MPNMILNRDYTLSSLFGHSIAFKKDAVTSVPPAVYAEALAIGATLADGGPANILKDDPTDPVPADPAERAAQILAAITRLVVRNHRGDFAASGMPAVKAVSRETGFDVPAREVTAAWQAYNDAKAAT